MGLRHAVALTLILIGPGLAADRTTAGVVRAALVQRAGAAKPGPREALAAARRYLAGWQETLTSLVADEDYRQEVKEYRRAFSGWQMHGTQRRQLRSELLLLRAPAENVWLSFRDVIAVDGTVVGDRQKRFDALFSGPVALMYSTAERIAEEGARYNLGRMTRTINSPTAGLVLLHPTYDANTKWALDAGERFEGRPAWELRFDQRKPPFAVKVPGTASYSASGAFYLEPGTGRILAWELNVRGGPSTFRVRTRYGMAPSVREGWVPLRMEDDYDVRRVERLRGLATYSNHRLFRTAGRIIGPVF